MNNSKQLRALMRYRGWAEKRVGMLVKWKRTLPFGDYVVDRWAKGEGIGFWRGILLVMIALSLLEM